MPAYRRTVCGHGVCTGRFVRRQAAVNAEARSAERVWSKQTALNHNGTLRTHMFCQKSIRPAQHYFNIIIVLYLPINFNTRTYKI